MNAHSTDFAAWLQDSIRERPDIKNQKQLAELLNVYASTVHYWIKGTTEPDETNIVRLADIFEVDKVFILRLLGKAPAVAYENVVLAQPEAEIVRDLIDLRPDEKVWERTLFAVKAVLDVSKLKADAPAGDSE